MVFLGCAHFVYAQDTFPFKGEVNSNGINIRSDSTPNSQVICTLNKAEQVEVVREFFEWYKIALPGKAPSYIKKRFVACADEVLDGPCKSGRVINDRVNVRLRPDESSAILGKVNKTDTLVILGEENGWYRIEPVVNSFGWIHKKFIRRLPPLIENNQQVGN